jgi:hypothetical protein
MNVRKISEDKEFPGWGDLVWYILSKRHPKALTTALKTFIHEESIPAWNQLHGGINFS